MLKLHIGNISDKEKRMETKKLIDCCEFISDGDHLPPPKSDSGVPFITISNITGQNKLSFEDTMFVPESYYNGLNENKKAQKGDILYSVVGSFGKPVYVDFDKQMVFQRHIAILRPKRNVNARFIYYTMLNPQFYKLVDKLAIGCSQRTVTLDTLRNIEVNLPDKDIQDKMVGILSLIDEKIANNNAINDNLEQQLMLLYDYWFTQFDFPDNDGNPYQTSGGKVVWNDTLKRNIPENWKVQSVISNCLSSIIKPGVEIFNTKTYLATADVKGTSISTGTIVDYDGRESRANMQPSINSVWFAKMKNSVKHLYLNKEMQPIISSSILSTGFCGLQCNEISFEYIASYVSNAYFEIHKDMLAHGATQEAVNNDDLAGVHIIIPEDTVLRAYHEATQAIYAQISKNICENQELFKLRDWLLPMLMNGQATISD
ncbi:restriction endonuclease subunit S [Lachnospira eligens]|uniref:Restriction endonuclease subunit S n=2 Tax=Lachnospira eligens TaxID=39485 RepID=A0A414D7U4_9FIRM|nr:restriction endonuclease subunit S [Lachnospira eligens]